MQHPTKQEKVDALMRANRSLDFETACLLLGYKTDDRELRKPVRIDELFAETEQTIAPVDEQAIHDSMRGRDFDFNTTTPIEVYTEGFKAGKATAEQTIADLRKQNHELFKSAVGSDREWKELLDLARLQCQIYRKHLPEDLAKELDNEGVTKAGPEYRGRIAELEAQITDLTAKLRSWEEKEASVCPEDVGFVEHIQSLTAKLDEAKAEISAKNTALGMDKYEILNVMFKCKQELEEAKKTIENDCWTGEMQRALGYIPSEFVGKDRWEYGVKRMADKITELREQLSASEAKLEFLRRRKYAELKRATATDQEIDRLSTEYHLICEEQERVEYDVMAQRAEFAPYVTPSGGL